MFFIKKQFVFLKDPYPIWIADGFLKDEVLLDVKKSWTPIEASAWHRGYEKVGNRENLLEKRMRAISKLKKMPDVIQNLFRKIHSVEFTDYLSSVTGIEGLVVDETMRWSGMRTMLEGSHQLIHSDARKHPVNGLRKELSCLIYINEKDYVKSRDQGCLEIWSDDMKERVHEIEPIDNRLVVFQNTDTSYHGVPKVCFERKALIFSVMKEAEASSRTKALFVRRSQDPIEIEKIGLERSFIKDK